MTKNQLARESGVPKAFRQYAARYGDGVEALLQAHKQYPAAMLDHWRDRREAVQRALGVLRGGQCA